MLIKIVFNDKNIFAIDKIYNHVDDYIIDLKSIFGNEFNGVYTREMLDREGIVILGTYLVVVMNHKKMNLILAQFPYILKFIREVKINLMLL